MINIEKVTVEDSEELLNIYAPYVKNTAISFECEVPSLKEFEERIRTISRKYPYIKAVDEAEHILGYAYANAFKGRAAYNWSVESTVYVLSDEKGKGIGTLLYHALENALQGMGILNVNACIAKPREMDPYLTNGSYEFHKKMGYELVGTFHNSGYKFDRWYDMVWMEKMIGTHEKNQPEVKFGQWEI